MEPFRQILRLRTMVKQLLPSLATVVLLGQSQVAHASPLVSANGQTPISTFTPTQTASTGSVSDAESGSNSAAAAEARAFASFGLLRAFGTSVTLGRDTNGNSYSVFGSGTASFRDDYLIDAPGLTGTAGTVLVRFTIDGALTTSTNGTPTEFSSSAQNTNALANYTFGVDPGNSPTKQERVFGNGGRDGDLFLGIPQEIMLDFTYGTLLTNVTLKIVAGSQAAGEARTYTSTTTTDMENTATWGGFGAVRDASGNVVNNYTFSSSSGFDYTQPIPEPGTLSLLFAVGVALGGTRLRRHMRGHC